MALWGNNDAVGSGGTVSLNYGTGVVTGSGTTFGQTGAAKTGDIIRFGERDGTFFGDAAIVSIAGTQSLTIGSTMGLSGASIAGTSFFITEAPQYTVLDRSFSDSSHINHEGPGYVTQFTGTATTNAGIGSTCIPLFVGHRSHLKRHIQVGDTIVNDSNNIAIVSIGTCLARTTTNSGIGSNKISVPTVPGLKAGDKFHLGGVEHSITIVGRNPAGASIVTLGSTIASGIATNQSVLFSGTDLIGLEGPLTAGIATDADVVFQRLVAGYDKLVYGISTDTSGSYHVSHQGWVGVTTYLDNQGNLRVKSEVLVAGSGINTAPDGFGQSIQYPTTQG